MWGWSKAIPASSEALQAYSQPLPAQCQLAPSPYLLAPCPLPTDSEPLLAGSEALPLSSITIIPYWAGYQTNIHQTLMKLLGQKGTADCTVVLVVVGIIMEVTSMSMRTSVDMRAIVLLALGRSYSASVIGDVHICEGGGIATIWTILFCLCHKL